MALSRDQILKRTEAARSQRQDEAKFPIFKAVADPAKKDRLVPNRVFFADDGTPEGSSYMVPLAFHHKIFDEDGTELHPICNHVVFGKKCAPCIYAKRLRAHGQEDEARDVEAKDSFLGQVIVMPMKFNGATQKWVSAPDEAERVWKLFYMTGKQTDNINGMMNEVAEEFECDFTDPEQGLLIEFQAKGMKMLRRYELYKVCRKAGRGIAECFGWDAKQVAELWKARIDLTKVHTKSYDQAKLASILGLDWETEGEEDDERPAPKQGKAAPNEDVPPPRKSAPPAQDEDDPPPPRKKGNGSAPAKAAKPPADVDEEEEDDPPARPSVKNKPAPRRPAPADDDSDDDTLDPDEVIARAKRRGAASKAAAPEEDDAPPPRKPGTKPPVVEDEE